ncbi:glycolate oxidase, iron-sulfur subunit [Roseibium sp. TrichSKD4]|nr:glycolate oxidase, iron-sulfur subunit [Roseibium sp. TrichSKD4]
MDGFRTIDHIGTTDASKAGSIRNIHAYITEDDGAGVETGNYFLEIHDRLKTGDQIFCSLDVAGTPTGRIYIVTASSASTVSIAPFQAAAIA